MIIHFKKGKRTKKLTSETSWLINILILLEKELLTTGEELVGLFPRMQEVTLMKQQHLFLPTKKFSNAQDTIFNLYFLAGEFSFISISDM